jgi:hypothetical protein
LGYVTWRPEESHLAPEVKTANERICDFAIIVGLVIKQILKLLSILIKI